MTATLGAVQQLDRRAVQPFLPALDAWLLGGSVYGVQHTWPQLYRSDGDGAFFVVKEHGELLSHCALRHVTLHTQHGAVPVGLLGSVVTAPSRRGEGLAGRVLQAALDACAGSTRMVLLWAERAELYARHGFVGGAAETCLLLARRPRRDAANVRRADVRDFERLHMLHERKPLRVERSLRTISTLLTTPGMTTVVLERDGEVVAYACCGKGADLHGHWHELGGSDEDLAVLLPAAMHTVAQVEAALLLPPYRPRLRALLASHTIGESLIPGPMVRAGGAVPPFFIDGLDSV